MNAKRSRAVVVLGVVISAVCSSAAVALRTDGAVFSVSTCPSCSERHPFVALQPGGGAVAWENDGVFGTELVARQIDLTGLPVDSAIRLTFLIFSEPVLGPLDIAPDGKPWATFAMADGAEEELFFSEVAHNRMAFGLRSTPDATDLEPGGLVALGGANVMASFEDLAIDGTSRQWVWRLGLPPAGEARQVSSTQGPGKPRICPRPDGTFVVAWRTRSDDSYGVAYSLRGPDGDEIRPATPLVENLTAEPHHALACGRDGRFAIAWESSVHPKAKGVDIVLQHFDRNARKIRGGEVAHSAVAGDQRSPALAFESDGALWTAFQSTHRGRRQIFARRFLAKAAPDGVEARVDTGPGAVTEAGPTHPGIAAIGTAGRALVVWSEDQSILGRRLRR